MTTSIPNCPQGETQIMDRAYTPEQEAARAWSLYTREQVIEMATNVRDCAWPDEVKEYMVLIEPMLRAFAATLPQKAQTQHPDDAAVDRFAAALKVKLSEARAKGRGGWSDDEPGMQQRLSDMLRAHVEKGDPRDVGNFAMFLHQRGESILPAQNARVEAVAAGYITAKDVEFLRAAKRPSEARIASEPFGNMTVPVYLHAERARVPESVLRLPEKWRSQGENIGPSVGHLARAVCAHELDALLAAAPSQPEAADHD